MKKWFFIWVALLVAAVTIIAVHSMRTASPVTTDIFSLLPAEDRDPLLSEATKLSRDEFFREVLFLVSASDQQDAEQAAGRILAAIDSIDWAEIRKDSDSASLLLNTYLENRFQLLSRDDRRNLEKDPGGHFRNRVLSRLTMPGMDSVYSLEQDPAGMLSRFVASLPFPYPDMQPTAHGYRMVSNGRHYRLIVARLVDAEFAPARQSQLAGEVASAKQAIADRCPDCTLSWTGAIRFAAAARESAEQDVRFISSLSLVLIVFLFLAVFRSPATFFHALLPLLTGVVFGLAACLVVFTQIHVLTLVFGTTLLGLTIDYVFHFLVHRCTGRSGVETLRQVLPGLSLGLATSLTAFAFLLTAGFPALNQVAVFSLAGLAGGWFTVVAVLPHLPAASVSSSRRLVRFANLHQHITSHTKFRFALLICSGIAAAIGIGFVEVNDDVRELQSTPTQLLQNDQELRQTIGARTGSDFFLITGSDSDERLAREEELFERAGSAGLGVSRFIPSSTRRNENRLLYQPLFEAVAADGRSVAANVLHEAGFRHAVTDSYIEAWQHQSSAAETRRWLQALTSADVRLPIIETTDHIAHIARLDGQLNIPQAELAADIEGVQYVQPLEHIRTVFSEIRSRAALAVALAYLLVGALLVFRYGLRGTLLVLAPGAIGGFLAVGALGLSGLPLTVFSLMGIILVLGIGADYSLFLREGGDQAEETGLAVSLAALTTLFSFGLLTFSAVPALTGFGLAVAVGILGAYLAAPLCNAAGSSTTAAAEAAGTSS